MNINLHIFHHLSEEDREPLIAIYYRLTSILEGIDMLSKEVQDLMDQSKKNTDVLKSMQFRYDALATLVGQQQQMINDLRAGQVLAPEDKAKLVALTGDMAAAFSSATDDITKNTPLENANANTGGVASNIAADLANSPRTDSSVGLNASNPGPGDTGKIVDGNTVGSLAGSAPSVDTSARPAPADATASDVVGAKTQGVGDEAGVGTDANKPPANVDGQASDLNASPATGTGIAPGRDAAGNPVDPNAPKT